MKERFKVFGPIFVIAVCLLYLATFFSCVDGSNPCIRDCRAEGDDPPEFVCPVNELPQHSVLDAGVERFLIRVISQGFKVNGVARTNQGRYLVWFEKEDYHIAMAIAPALGHGVALSCEEALTLHNEWLAAGDYERTEEE